MQDGSPIPQSPDAVMRQFQPDAPVACFCPKVLQDTAQRFLRDFPGRVTYAVKANPRPEVLDTLVAAGVTAFDVASPQEMAAVRQAMPGAVLHYHNPVRSRDEIVAGRLAGVTSWSVDCVGELDKLGDLAGTEIAVRLKLPVGGAAYDFGSKFGAEPDQASALLRKVGERGALASLTFHPGTQCTDPAAWVAYIQAAADVARSAGVVLHRLNVGGGFPSGLHDLSSVFDAIKASANAAFGRDHPELVCEPGRAMVAGSYALILRVKGVRPDGSVFLNDGLYGGLAEWRDLVTGRDVCVLDGTGCARVGKSVPRTIFGPTCDSIDRVPDQVSLPSDTDEGDFVLIPDAGAYSLALATRFNGYGVRDVITVRSLDCRAGHRA